MPVELSKLKKDVTTETYSCYHICQICGNLYFHNRRAHFTVGCSFPKVAGYCPECKKKIVLRYQYIQQGRALPPELQNYPEPIWKTSRKKKYPPWAHKYV